MTPESKKDITLDFLEEKLTHFNPAVAMPSNAPGFGGFIVDCLCMPRARSGKEAVTCYKLADKIRKADGVAIDVTAQEFAIILDRVQANDLNWAAYFQAQILIKLEEARDRVPEMEVK